MRTFEYSKSTDHLGRYYTQSAISNLLVELLPATTPASVLDLGAGEGALSLAASSKWKETSLITIDVDKVAAKVLSRRLQDDGFRGCHHHVPSDALNLDLKTVLTSCNVGPLNIAVCNPPFLMLKLRKRYNQILEEAGLNTLPAITSTDSAALFLAQNMRLLSEGGSLGIIVPDSLVCAEKYYDFRKLLLSNYEILRAIRLPRGAFVGTDALAHILIINKTAPKSEKIHLACLSQDMKLTQNMTVEREQAIKRLDYTFHSAQSTNRSTLKLSNVVVDVRRGNLNSAEVRAAQSFVLHTTDISENICGQWVDFSNRRFKPGKHEKTTPVATAGDIVIARVGRNAARKVIGVASGSVALSDCLYRIQVQPEFREHVLQSLASDRGHRWMELHAYGVAAQHINKTDLLNMPLSEL